MKPQVRIYHDINSWVVELTDNYESWFFGFIRRKTRIVFVIMCEGETPTEFKKFYAVAKTKALELAEEKGVTLVYSGKAEAMNMEEPDYKEGSLD